MGWIALFNETSVALNSSVFIRIKERGGVTAYTEQVCGICRIKKADLVDQVGAVSTGKQSSGRK